MRKQLNLWTRNTSSREAYTCWAHQQANPNLSEIPITQIPDLMQTNAEKGKPMFFGCLKSDYGASSSSQPDQQDLASKLEAEDKQPMPRHGSQSLGVAKQGPSLQDHPKPTPRHGQASQAQCLGATPTPRHPLIIQDPRLGA
ncbi:hypothetical protein PIB30_094816 [Stylosanthes scabra]|uniref:Uncharacterized protein n=1 Tax=Stylosanthes scabra TaxID=79078 RepID=A0ABU6ZUA0_9FABA|nr:hypothetical protein [Stylosanthes scabra]